MAAAKIDLIAIEKWFGDSQVIKGVDLHIESGELIVFVGPSGCGKSTLLRIIAGLTDASRGQVLINGRDVTGELPAQRGLAMVFQSYALYPHMTVRENMGFALKSAGQPADKVAAKVQEVAQVLQLDELLARTPKELSGGQRQRVAIGRAIVRDPVAFLFDEPLSNLDAALRIEMRFEIARLHRILGAPMIYVTHDQVEAMTLADRIVVLREGRVEQVGSPRELYEKPATKFVAQFIGSPKMNIMPCTAQAGKLVLDGTPTSIAAGAGSPVELGVRPEHIALTSPGEGDCKGTVALAEYLGADLMIYADCGQLGMITIRCSGNEKHAVGDECGLRLDRENIHLLDDKQQVLETS